MENKDEINYELVEQFINTIVDRIENNEGSYDVGNVYNSNEISLSFFKKIYQSNFFKRTRYLLKDILISKKLSS